MSKVELTGETISDEQIRGLRVWAEARIGRGLVEESEREAHDAAVEASVPRMLMPMLSHEDYMATKHARARCAEILNARSAE